MSGGYFDRSTYAMREIANTIERDIARALQPKPEKVQEDYWTIYEKDCFGSYHSYKDFMSFGSYEDAESFLLRDKTVIVKTCSDSLFSIGQKNCQLFVAKLRNFLDSHNRMVLY